MKKEILFIVKNESNNLFVSRRLWRIFFIFLFLAFFNNLPLFAQEDKKSILAPLSEETQECVGCHESETPGIVEDWLKSAHSKITSETSLKKPVLERIVSNDKIPGNLRSFAVGCYECHSLNPAGHKDNFDHNDFKINVVVSPRDCGVCHSTEEKQYSMSKKARAVDILEKNPVYHTLVDTIIGVNEVKGSKIISSKPAEITKGKTCFACHGTKLEVKGMKTISTEGGDIKVPNITNWPNQGVGRINPDRSLGSCSACHPRHSFSIEIARKPYTCSQCHLAPDVPAWEIYRESKHGNIFSSKQNEWNWNHVPWRVGKDFQAPTCASCHNSLLTTSGGDVIAQRTHDFGSRLWVRIFGLIYSHPQPKSGETYLIKNRVGLAMPTTFDGKPASMYLLDKDEQAQRKGIMTKVCQSCHGTDWVNGHFEQLDHTIIETDKMVLSATILMRKAWNKGLAEPSNPFDEAIERRWMLQWLFYANSTRYAAAMGGPDYATFKYGWWNLTKNLQEMKDSIELKSKKTETPQNHN